MLHPVAKEPGVRPSPSSRKPSRDAGEKSGAGNRDRTGDIQLGKIEIGSGIAGDPWGRGAGRAFLVVPSHPTGIPKQHREQSANSLTEERTGAPTSWSAATSAAPPLMGAATSFPRLLSAPTSEGVAVKVSPPYFSHRLPSFLEHHHGQHALPVMVSSIPIRLSVPTRARRQDVES
jgi:hypothetical protein